MDFADGTSWRPGQPVTNEQEKLAATVLAAHDPSPTPAEVRAKILRACGYDERQAALILVLARVEKAPDWARKCLECCAQEIEATDVGM